MAVPTTTFNNTDNLQIWQELDELNTAISGGGTGLALDSSLHETKTGFGQSIADVLVSTVGQNIAGDLLQTISDNSDTIKLLLGETAGNTIAELLYYTPNAKTLAQMVNSILDCENGNNLTGSAARLVQVLAALTNTSSGRVIGNTLEKEVPNLISAPQDISGNTGINFQSTSVTGTATLYTVTPGKILYLTSLEIGVLTNATGRFVVRDGAGGNIITVVGFSATAVMNVNRAFAIPIKLTTSVYIEILSGSLTSGVAAGVGYEK
jgi:hypothetical protein